MDSEGGKAGSRCLGTTRVAVMNPAAPVQEARITAIMFVLIFAIGCDTFLVAPFIPTLAHSFGVTEAAGGHFVLAYALSYAVSAIVLGPLSDRIGRRRMLQGGITAFTIFTTLCGLSWNYESMLLFRALSGVAAAAVSPQVWASIGDLFPYEKRGKVLGIVTSALSISQILGVPLAALTASLWGWRASIIIVAAVSLMGGIAFIFGFPRLQHALTKGDAQESITAVIVSRLMRAVRNRSALVGLGVMLGMSMGSLGMYTYIGVYLSDYFNMTLSDIGVSIVVVGLGNLTGNLAGGFTSDQWGKRKTALIFLLLMAASLFALPYASASLGLALMFIFVWQLSGGASLVAFNAVLSELDPSVRGTVMSLNNSAMYLGTTLGVAINGWLYLQFDFMGIGLFCGTAILIAAISMFLLGKRPADQKTHIAYK
ncbi:MFS transporter [Paenibacillus sp. SI8]|uniref:MFS transporter n=1 Tax=unclassified Paenibacillus TaxID=185978 RepID=UPI003467E419